MKKLLLLIIALLFLTPALLATATTETMPENANNSPAFDADTDNWSNWFDTDNFQPFDNSWAARRDIATAILVMGREPNLLTQNGNVPTNFAFADVPRSSFAFPSISWAAQRGWISHSASARFRPDDHITREEAIAMLVNSHPTTLPETGDLSRFSDQHLISAWARPFISRAVGAGWISGYPDGTFRPQGQITRANMIAVVRNATSRTVVIPGLFGITWQPHGGTAVDWWQRFGGHAIGPLPTTTRGTSPFIGWYRNNAKITQNTTQSQQNVTHSARWTITVTWNANGGTVSPTSRQQSSDAPVGTLPTPRRTNHTLRGWYTAQNGGTRISENHWTPHNNVTYWARWNVTITWDGNGGTSPAQWTDRAPGATLGTLPTTRRDGWEFLGWFTAAGSRIDANTIIPNNHVTYHARWQQVFRMDYNILVNTGFSTATAQGYVNQVAPAFLNTFQIQLVRQNTSTVTALNQRAGCNRQSSQGCAHHSIVPQLDCGPNASCRNAHHRSGGHFLRVNQGNRTRANFKFVNYRLCFLWEDGSGRHDDVYGLAFILGDTMIVTSQTNHPNAVTAHEISHLFGATDGGCNPTQHCVMRIGATEHNLWCNVHRDQILAGRHNR